jgi:hypothetical protein
MGQAKRKKMLSFKSKRYRFIELMRKISKYSDREIKQFAERRKLK